MACEFPRMPIITRISPGNRLLICQSEIGYGLEFPRHDDRIRSRTALQISSKAQFVTAILQFNRIGSFAQFDHCLLYTSGSC